GAGRWSGIDRTDSRPCATRYRRRRVWVRPPRPPIPHRQFRPGAQSKTTRKWESAPIGRRQWSRLNRWATLAGRADHPAVLAWARLHGHKQLPDAADVLKTGKAGRTSAYRLWGLGPGGGGVIVKCGSAAALEFERSIYQEVLPSLPLPSLRCYGFLEAGSTAWLFLEDAEQGSIFHRRSATGGAGPMAG